MKDSRLVWSDQEGDLRKKKDEERPDLPVDEKKLLLKLRRLTAGKGRVVIEITNLPKNKLWCRELAQTIKKKLGAGGSFKEQYIEIHIEHLDKVTGLLDGMSIQWKKIGG